jgi:hypothetical protein
MITAIVTLLGGWRATAFAAACIGLIGYTGWQRVELWRAESTITDLRQAADQHAAEDATAARKASDDAREHERAQANAFAEADTKHAREIADAYHVATELRTGTVSLRHDLTACRARTVPGTATPADDASPELRDAVARTVAIGARCDADIRSLQAKLMAERRP